VDGCDGEVARLRYQFSEFGKWYDSALDEVVFTLFMIATGYHLAQEGWPGWLWIGVFAGLVNYAYGMVNFHCKWTTGLGIYWWFDLKNRPTGAVQPTTTQIGPTNVWGEFKTLFGRDAYLLYFLIAALVGGLPVLLGFLAAVSVAMLALLVLHIVVFRAPW
jgi:phosphatidylglycerophosphate synthase